MADDFTHGEESREALIASGLVRPSVEVPRDPTIEDRRKIMDALESWYDIPTNRYVKAMSDDKAARKLNVPRAWITQIRTAFFGLGGGCEADDETDAQIDAIRVDLDAVKGTLGRLEGMLIRLEERRGRR